MWVQKHRAYSVFTFVLLIETWGENSIFLLLHVKLLRMWAKTSHMQAAFISFYIKCFWFMSPQCLFPAWDKLWRWIPKKRKKERKRQRARARQRTTESTGRKKLGKSSNQSQTDLPSLECVSALQVFIRRYEYVGEKKTKKKNETAQLFNSFTVYLSRA